MRLGVPKQTEGDETRAPLVPSVVKRLVGAGVEVIVETGAGEGARQPDEAYEEAGATVVSDADEPPLEVWGADVVVTLEPPNSREVAVMDPGSVLIGLLDPLHNPALVKQLVDLRVTAISMEFIPRISRAQSMDVLSSQANIGGYKAVMLAADRCPKMFPMMITAAGTIAPSKVVVLGVGVAGLQAIATAKRLGAIVEANDIRAATKEQVQSLGARFIELPIAQEDKAAGGYATELTEEQKEQQQELVSKHIKAADVVITTAAVFGKAPPMLIPAGVVSQMATGSVIVDMAASPEHGRGNCELTEPGKVVEVEGKGGSVTIIGTGNLPGLVPVHASQVYANNMHNLLKEIIEMPKKGGDGEAQSDGPKLRLNLDDEIQKGAAITHDGQITNEMVRQAMGEKTSDPVA